MANVHVSANSLAAQREKIPQQRRRNVCRNLFGPVDHEVLNRELNAKLNEISERDQQRWNFNFASGTPLHGEYEWEIASVDGTPGFYQETRSGEKANDALPHPEAPTGANYARGSAVSSTKTGTPSCTKRKTSARLTTTTRVTDFYIKRRKPVDQKQPENAPVNPLRLLSSEKTPRKGLR